jgi:uncharacterized protein YjbI with pentapeptide repeats
MFGRRSHSDNRSHLNGETLTRLRSHQQVIIENLDLTSCTFDRCGTISHDLQRRSIIRNVTVRSCKEQNCTLIGAFLDNVTVDGLRISDSIIAWGCLFRHVTFAGKIDRIIFSDKVSARTQLA